MDSDHKSCVFLLFFFSPIDLMQCRKWSPEYDIIISSLAPLKPALMIKPSHQQNTHDFADGRKNMNGIFNDYVCSASHMNLRRHFQNV